MTRASEARFWQGIGAAVGIAGGFLLAYTYGRFGLAFVGRQALAFATAGSFIVLAGAAAFLAGRALHVEDAALTPRESRLWFLLAYVCLFGGAFLVVLASIHPLESMMDRLSTGLAGAFAMMMGVLCLVGQRVMAHMHDVLVQKSEEKSRSASA